MESSPETFRYSARTDTVVVVYWLVLETIATFVALAVLRSSIGLGLIFGLAAAALFVLPAREWVRHHRPVRVDTSGISSTLAGRPWVTLPWASVQLVVKIERRVALTNFIRYFVRVVGPQGTVSFNNYITNFDLLIERMNIHLAGKDVAMQLEDWSGPSKRILSRGSFSLGQRL